MRRSNKSHKVPNVKLRPAPLQPRPAYAYDPDASCDRSSDSEIPPNASMVDLCPRPFKGFTICATGTMDKPTLFKMAFELGATSTSDFTDRVTHLVASSHGGAKYMCALERKIPIMTPDWIAEAHAVWLRGDDVDVQQSMSQHRLSIFSGVVLSLSGIEDVHRRTEINRLVTAHQGTYLKNLERPVRVTHLLCSGDSETDKMKYAEKFNKRKEAHIHLVWEEWFWDSLEYGGRFDEKKYQASRPRPERKSLHDIPISSLPVQNSAPGSHPSSAIPVDGADQPKRPKLVVPTGSFTVINNLHVDDEEEEMAIVNKPVPAVTLQLWQSLLKPRGFELDGGKLVRSPSKSQAARPLPSTPSRPPARPDRVNRHGTGVEPQKEKEKESVISSFRRAQSFAPVPLKEPTVRQPFRRNTTCPVVCPGETEGSGLHDLVRPGESSMTTLFAGHTFRLLGEARCPNVRSAIENGGGVVTDDDAGEPSFIIVRLISGSKLYRDEFDDYARTKYRTECWLEHSVFHERICETDENVSFTPLKIATPVPDAETIRLSLSGLDQSELCWIRRLVRAVGITLEPTFSRRSTHLLCPSGTGAKFDKAAEWHIPVVSLAWLEGIAQTGTVSRADEYLVAGSDAGPVIDRVNGIECGQNLDFIPETKRDKGKGKERERDYRMMDTANGDSDNQPMFVKNTALLQDPSPRVSGVQRNCDKTSERNSPCNGLFGKARFLTHDSDPPEGPEGLGTVSSPPAPPPLSSSPPLAETELPLFGLTPPVLVSLVPTRQPTASIGERDAKTQANIDAQTNPGVQAPTHAPTPPLTQAQARIPSSTSPSPIKLLPSSSLPYAFAPSSAPRLPDTDSITKALHESLTSLLGKRPIAEEDRDEAMRDAGGAGPGGKKGKRMRPRGPSTLPSRNASRENVIVISPPRPIVRSPVLPVPPVEVDMSMSLFDGLGIGATGAARSTEESMRVTYEDPGQAEEKRRLLRMLGGDETDVCGTRVGGSGASREVGRARRTRRAKVPGF